MPHESKPATFLGTGVWPAAALCLLGGTVLTGWATGVIELARVFPGTTAMAINTAAMFLVCGLGLLGAAAPPGRATGRMVRIAAAVLVAWPAAILSQSLTGVDYGIDWPAIHAALRDGHGKPGRMAPNACIGFICAGGALWFAAGGDALRRAGARRVLSWAVLAIGVAGFVGYLLDLESLYRVARFNQMAALTAIGLMLAGAGLVQSALVAGRTVARTRPWTAQRITWFAAGLLALFALATSLTAFGLLKRSYEGIASENLLQAARQSATGTSSLIEQAALLHLAVAARPALAHAVAARLDGRGEAALRLEEQSTLALGIQTVVVTAPDGQKLVQAGRPPAAPLAPALALGGTATAWLLWRDGFVYRTEHQLYDGGRFVGTVALERNLEALTAFLAQAQKSSATTDAVLCGRAGDRLFCFPSRFSPDPAWHELLDASGKPRWPVVRALLGESGAMPVKGDARGVPVIAAYVPLARERLGLVQKLETQELYAPLRERLPLIVGSALVLIVLCTVLLRRRVEPLVEQVLDERARMRAVLDGANDAFIAVDASGTITQWNVQAERMLGRDAAHAVGSPLVTCLPGIDPGLAQAARGGDGWNGSRRAEILSRTASGEDIPLEISIAPIRDAEGEDAASIFARDLTAQKASEQQLAQTQRELLQAQKLDAIGKLTGGVAHDFNNLLQVIGANTALLARESGASANAQRLIAACSRAVERGSRLAAQLLAFARRQPLQPVALDVNQQVLGMDDMLRRTLGERISVETVLAGGLWRTLADPHGLENVLLNLAINARDAMPEGGKLTIETANVELDDAYARTVDELRPGQYVMVALSDTGTGMPPDVAARAFDPFFTTKPEGKGTGLGLSMAYGFAKQTGGHIRIYSELGAGTTIKLYLPRTLAAAADVRPAPAAQVRGGSETILVVEDDAAVRACVVDMLHALGYETLQAENGAQALEVVRSARTLHLLFTDVVMPGPVRSPDLARQARLLRPDIEVLFTSGYTQNAIVHGGRLDPGVELLSKPYSQDELARRVRKLLDNRGGRQPAAAGEAGSGTAARQPLHVLFVEDDPELRSTTQELLELLGTTVTSVASAEDAMEALSRRPADILITDLSLPGKTGHELAAWARRNMPGLRIAFASGYGLAIEAPPGVAVLAKPYTCDDLEKLISSVETRGVREVA